MQNLNFDDGYKKFTINGDPDRVVSFNPADYNILERFEQAQRNIESAQAELTKDIALNEDGTSASDAEDAVELIGKVNTLIKEQTDFIFNGAVSETIYGNQSPISSIKGKLLFERFFESVIPLISKEIEKEQKESQKRVQTYTSQLTDHKKPTRKRVAK